MRILYIVLLCVSAFGQVRIPGVGGSAPSGGTPPAFVGAGQKFGSTTVGGLAMTGINMTSPVNATILTACASYSGTAPTMTDSSGNTWTTGTTASSISGLTVYYAVNPTVTNSMTFTLTGTATIPSFYVAGFSGVATSSPYDSTAGTKSAANTGGGSTTAQAGSLTPTVANELIWACTGAPQAGFVWPVTINSGFTISGQYPFNVASTGNYGGAAAYLSYSSTSPINPTWTYSGNAQWAAILLAFHQ